MPITFYREIIIIKTIYILYFKFDKKLSYYIKLLYYIKLNNYIIVLTLIKKNKGEIFDKNLFKYQMYIYFINTVSVFGLRHSQTHIFHSLFGFSLIYLTDLSLI